MLGEIKAVCRDTGGNYLVELATAIMCNAHFPRYSCVSIEKKLLEQISCCNVLQRMQVLFLYLVFIVFFVITLLEEAQWNSFES